MDYTTIREALRRLPCYLDPWISTTKPQSPTCILTITQRPVPNLHKRRSNPCQALLRLAGIIGQICLTCDEGTPRIFLVNVLSHEGLCGCVPVLPSCAHAIKIAEDAVCSSTTPLHR